MDNVLYYPFINLPNNSWTIRTLLYYDTIGAIVPMQWNADPEKNYNKFMYSLIKDELVIPFDPQSIVLNSYQFTTDFINYIKSDPKKLKDHQDVFKVSREIGLGLTRIFEHKFDISLFEELTSLKLAIREKGNPLGFPSYLVETRTASEVMLFLAILLGDKTNRLPVTNEIFTYDCFSPENKRHVILRRIVPVPSFINLQQLHKFKEKHNDLLIAFRNRVETLVHDPNMIEGSVLFESKLRELECQRDELSARMVEFKFYRITYSAIAGVLAILGNAELGPYAAGFSFLEALYSSLRSQRPETAIDQTGIKYLSLAERRISRKSMLKIENFNFSSRNQF